MKWYSFFLYFNLIAFKSLTIGTLLIIMLSLCVKQGSNSYQDMYIDQQTGRLKMNCSWHTFIRSLFAQIFCLFVYYSYTASHQPYFFLNTEETVSFSSISDACLADVHKGWLSTDPL